MNRKKILGISACVFSIALFAVVGTANAATTCTFTTVGTTMNLDADCTTDATILVPDGFTLDGKGHTITAVDPAGDHFRGAVVANDGTTAHVKNLTVDTDSLANVCDGGDDRLRGIMFDGASGSITHNNVNNINQGASGCQEGNAIEVRNEPFDGTHPDTQTVEIAHNVLSDWQKTGIVANGDVDVNIHHNDVNESATQVNLAANSIQLGFGALGVVEYNNVKGNQWCGPSNFVATALLLFLTGDGVNVSFNNIGGNSDVGIYALNNMTTISTNRVFDDPAIADCNVNGYNIGIGDYDVFTNLFGGTGADDNSVTRNVVRGFDTPYDGVLGGRNITVPGPQPSSDAF
ncbi:hypothetical protein HY468_01455 [Candidatus Roizmanbacteria bacterium]|nr:hypothetical protein [Candidatus Roizmanbacteria bacterium]